MGFTGPQLGHADMSQMARAAAELVEAARSSLATATPVERSLMDLLAAHIRQTICVPMVGAETITDEQLTGAVLGIAVAESLRGVDTNMAYIVCVLAAHPEVLG